MMEQLALSERKFPNMIQVSKGFDQARKRGVERFYGDPDQFSINQPSYQLVENEHLNHHS